jgi:hypothetical protein
MYLLFFVALLLKVALSWLNFYLLIILTLVYLLSYFDGKEYTGERRWDGFRRFPLWRRVSPITYSFANINDLQRSGKRLYVLLPGDTLVSLVWGIGLHGGALSSFAERLHYIVPPIFMWIPILRDVLLWSGAVTYDAKKRPMNGLILDLIQNNRSVCYCPSGLANVVIPQDLESQNTIVTPSPHDEIFTFARESELEMVPIIVHNERKRYHILHVPRVQTFFYQHIGYPFPMCFVLKAFQKKKPPMLHMDFLSIVHCGKYVDNGTLRESFVTLVKNSHGKESGVDELHLA